MTIVDWIKTIFSQNREKKKIQKQLKDLRQSVRPGKKLFDSTTEDFLPLFAEKIFEIYKAIKPAIPYLKQVRNSTLLTDVLIKTALPQELKVIKKNLSSENLEEIIKDYQRIEDYKKYVGEQERLLEVALRREGAKINRYYNSILILYTLIYFNYTDILSYFDPIVRLSNKAYTPDFTRANGELIRASVEDFLYAILPFRVNEEWPVIFDVINQYRGVSVISEAEWKKAVKNINELKNNHLLLNIVRLLRKDPGFKMKSQPPSKDIVNPFLINLKRRIQQHYINFHKKKNTLDIQTHVSHIFKPEVIADSSKKGKKLIDTLVSYGINTDDFITPLYLLQNFLDENFLTGNISILIEELIVRGVWGDKESSQELSQNYRYLKRTLYDEISQFIEKNLQEDSTLKIRLLKIIQLSEKDISAKNHIIPMIDELNGKCYTYLKKGLASTDAVLHVVNAVFFEFRQRERSSIQNWRELNSKFSGDLNSIFQLSIERLDVFAKILKFYLYSESRMTEKKEKIGEGELP